jgi:hypothetical protein
LLIAASFLRVAFELREHLGVAQEFAIKDEQSHVAVFPVVVRAKDQAGFVLAQVFRDQKSFTKRRTGCKLRFLRFRWRRLADFCGWRAIQDASFGYRRLTICF